MHAHHHHHSGAVQRAGVPAMRDYLSAHLFDQRLREARDLGRNIRRAEAGTSPSSDLEGHAEDNDDDARLTAAEQGDVVENVEWVQSPSRTNSRSGGSGNFIANFMDSLRVTNMSGRAKLLVRARFVPLYEQYARSHRISLYLNNGARAFVAIGSLLIPALVALDQDLKEMGTRARITYYTVFVLGISVGVVSSLAEVTQLPRRCYSNARARYSLEHEAWSFMLLRGRYRGSFDHRDCWPAFLYRAERAHQLAASQDVLLYQPSPERGGPRNNASSNDYGPFRRGNGSSDFLFRDNMPRGTASSQNASASAETGSDDDLMRHSSGFDLAARGDAMGSGNRQLHQILASDLAVKDGEAIIIPVTDQPILERGLQDSVRTTSATCG